MYLCAQIQAHLWICAHNFLGHVSFMFSIAWQLFMFFFFFCAQNPDAYKAAWKLLKVGIYYRFTTLN